MNKFAVEMMKRLFGKESIDGENSQPEEEIQEIQGVKDFAQEFAEALANMREAASNQSSDVIDFKKEMTLYAKTKQRTSTLDKLFDALKTIQATSVTAERNFSAASNIVTKQRNRLLDENINALVFLKGYFKNKDNKM
jgi:uncharacterized protein YbgA (DUF1722 family)